MMKLKRHQVGTFLLAFGMMEISVGRASSVLDQSNLATPFFQTGWAPSTPPSPPGMFAETFTVGLTGYLTEVDLRVGQYGPAAGNPFSAGNFTVDVRSTVAGVPGVSSTSVLASVTTSLASLPGEPAPPGFAPGFTSFVFSGTGPLVHAGDVLAITTSNDTTGSSYWVWGGGAYGGGNPFLKRVPATAWAADDSQDFSFETFVTPLPLPSAVGEGLVGLACVAAVMWATRRKGAAISK